VARFVVALIEEVLGLVDWRNLKLLGKNESLQFFLK
jgi:hypothetical protein